MSLGFTEILLILVVILLLFGEKESRKLQEQWEELPMSIKKLRIF